MASMLFRVVYTCVFSEESIVRFINDKRFIQGMERIQSMGICTRYVGLYKILRSMLDVEIYAGYGDLFRK